MDFQKNLFRLLFNAIQEGLIIVDDKGKIILCNDVCEKLFFYDKNELIGRSIDILVPKPYRGNHAGEREKYNKHPTKRSMGSLLKLSGERKDGSVFPVEISLNPFTKDGKKYVAALVSDVTLRRKAEEELLELTKNLEDKVRERTAELVKQKEKIEKQHKELQIKSKEILDSIIYAKRIQSAILPPPKLVKTYLNQSFILYLPKDVVAGDFYWIEPKEENILFAVGDCTGHGVPGAIVSVICNNGLNRSVREFNLNTPAAILDKTKELVEKEFEKSEDEVSDGMDIALVSLHHSSDNKVKVEYAGANNPLWVIREGEFEAEPNKSYVIHECEHTPLKMLEVKADKQPIGRSIKAEPYTNKTLHLKKGDCIYLFSDGFADQFGGEEKENGKKYKPQNFRELLFSIHDLSMEQQKQNIKEAFDSWMGALDQVDDVCVIGVRL